MNRRRFVQWAALGGASLALPLLLRSRRPPAKTDTPPRLSVPPQQHGGQSRRFSDARGNLCDIHPLENRIELRLPNGTLRAEVSGLLLPWSMTFDDQGRALVLENQGSRVQCLDLDARRLGRFGTRGRGAGELRSPQDLAAHGDHIVVADTHNHRLQIFDGDGRPRASLGKLGLAGEALNGPRSVAIGRDGNLYVADSGNHRVQIYSLEGRHLGSLGSYGKEPGQLLSLGSLRFDEKGRLHVADPIASCVHIFQGSRFVDRYRPSLPSGQPGVPVWLSNHADGSLLIGLLPA